MKLDVSLDCGIEHVAETAALAESHPLVAGVVRAEFTESPLLALALAASRARRVELVAAVAVAPAMTPLQTAYHAAAVERLAPGRLVLGLGSQIPTHARHRFGVDWRNPVERLREYVAVVRAAWRCFTGLDARPDVRGRYHRLTFLPEVFTPPLPAGATLRLALGGVGPRMTALAGEVADHYLFHSFTSAEYLATESLAFLDEGARNRSDGGPRPSVGGRVVTVWGRTDEERDAARERARFELAFHGSTPAYRRVLAHHGLDDLHRFLRRSVLAGRRDAALAAVDDEALAPFVVEGTPFEVGLRLAERFGPIADRVAIDIPPGIRRPTELRALLDELGTGLEARTPVTTSPTTEGT